MATIVLCMALAACAYLSLCSAAAAAFSDFSNDVKTAQIRSQGCRDPVHATIVADDVIACPGEWVGHIENGDDLCGEDFSICTWEDKDSILSRISWQIARQLPGCYAFDAAHDGNDCVPCKNDVESDDMAGFGRDCPHQNFGQSSCLGGGRIDASCCTDAERHEACTFKPSITTGVLCCKRESSREEPPIPEARPSQHQPALIRSFWGEKISMKCPLPIGELEEVVWTKNTKLMTKQHRGSWNISFSTAHDSGLYSCRKNNVLATIAYINLTVLTDKLKCLIIRGSSQDCVWICRVL